MIRLSAIPRKGANLYRLLVRKEFDLRMRGTFYRVRRKSGIETWKHKSYPGRITFQRCVGGSVIAVLRSRATATEWQMLSAFIGFLDRYFREDIASVTICYDDSRR